MYSGGSGSHVVVLVRNHSLLVSIRWDPLQNPVGLNPLEFLRIQKQILWSKFEWCFPLHAGASPACSVWARQILSQSLFEHACFFRREHKAIWHGLVIFFWNIGYVCTPSFTFFPFLSFSTWTSSGERKQSPSREGGAVRVEWPWGFCLCHCPRQVLINSNRKGFTRLQK